MIIIQVKPQENYKLYISSDDGRIGIFDVSPYLDSEAFKELKNKDSFRKVNNRKYFIEWDCGADLSADTIECKWKLILTDFITPEVATAINLNLGSVAV